MLRRLPQKITFQWHITNHCNFRCNHCYQDDYDFEGLQFSDLVDILTKISDFVVKCRDENGAIQAHINFTGGEPFLRKDFLQLLKKTREKEMFSFGILSNGYLPTAEELQDLKKLKPHFVQLSLEGTKITNDQIRGNGSFDKIIDAMKVYKRLKIPTMISFTATSKNYQEFSDVIKIARRYGAFKVWTDRYLPEKANDELMLSTEQTRILFKTIHQEQLNNKWHFFSKTKISSGRALQFLVCGGQPYKCTAGDTLLALLSNGDILPCRRLSVVIGNLLQDDLLEVYRNNELLKNLQCKDNLDEVCLRCYYKVSCRGGLKCLSFRCLGDISKKDVNCWL